jgi:hypothetical protein
MIIVIIQEEDLIQEMEKMMAMIVYIHSLHEEKRNIT